MSNMSYCRFRNTDGDLADCAAALRSLSLLEAEPLSRDELDAAQSLVSRCVSIVLAVADHGGADLSYGDLDSARFVDALREAIASMNAEAEATRDHADE